MAADCVTRVWALAIATAACIGLPSALVYAIVRMAAARRYGAVFALGVVLVFWVTVTRASAPTSSPGSASCAAPAANGVRESPRGWCRSGRRL
jgi:hypothetical protein